MSTHHNPESTTRGGGRQRRFDWLPVLDFIDTFQRTQHRSPSQRMIQHALHMSAPSVAYNVLHRLERDGLLLIKIRQRGYTAELEITERGRTRLQQWRAERMAAASGEGGQA